MLYWLFKRVLMGPAMNAAFQPWAEGLENIPESGPAILASNHLSFSDSLFLPLAVDRRITFPAKLEYFTGTGVKGRLTAAFFRGTGQIPIDRAGGSASQAAMDAGKRILADGELFGIYPEGTRSPDGKLYRGKTGAARLALETGAPVIPVAMVGTDVVQPIGKQWPNLERGTVGVRVGEPMTFERYAAVEADRAVYRAITDDIMYALMRLSGQEYVDEYAAVVKRQRAAALLKSATVEASARAKEASARAKEATGRAKEATREVTERVREDMSARAAEVSARAAEASAKAKEVTERARGAAGKGRAEPGGRSEAAPATEPGVKDSGAQELGITGRRDDAL